MKKKKKVQKNRLQKKNLSKGLYPSRRVKEYTPQDFQYTDKNDLGFKYSIKGPEVSTLYLKIKKLIVLFIIVILFSVIVFYVLFSLLLLPEDNPIVSKINELINMRAINDTSCSEKWVCSEWGNVNRYGVKCGVRDCVETNNCGTYNNKPNFAFNCEKSNLFHLSDDAFTVLILFTIFVLIAIIILLVHSMLNHIEL